MRWLLMAGLKVVSFSPWAIVNEGGLKEAPEAWTNVVPADDAASPRVVVFDLVVSEPSTDDVLAGIQLAGDHGVVLLFCGGQSFGLEASYLAALSTAVADVFFRRVLWFSPPQTQGTESAFDSQGWCTIVAAKRSPLWERIVASPCMLKGGLIGAMPPYQLEYDAGRHVLWKKRGSVFWKSFFSQLNFDSVGSALAPATASGLCVIEPYMTTADLSSYYIEKRLAHLRELRKSVDADGFANACKLKTFCGRITKLSGCNDNRDGVRQRLLKQLFEQADGELKEGATSTQRMLKRQKTNTDDDLSRMTENATAGLKEMKLPDILQKTLDGPPSGVPLSKQCIRFADDGMLDKSVYVAPKFVAKPSAFHLSSQMGMPLDLVSAQADARARQCRF